MEVQVVLAQVREDKDGEADFEEPLLLGAVRGGLEGGAEIAGVEHLAESALQVDRLGRRPIAALRSSPTRLSIVPSSPGFRPAASRIEYRRKDVVVLPFVPVTAATSSCSVGRPKNSAAE